MTQSNQRRPLLKRVVEVNAGGHKPISFLLVYRRDITVTRQLRSLMERDDPVTADIVGRLGYFDLPDRSSLTDIVGPDLRLWQMTCLVERELKERGDSPLLLGEGQVNVFHVRFHFIEAGGILPRLEPWLVIVRRRRKRLHLSCCKVGGTEWDAGTRVFTTRLDG